MRTKIIFSNVVLIVAGLLIVFINPVYMFFPTGCLFNKITGYYCAGCGISRCFYSLLRYDVHSAVHYNLLIITLFPVSILWLVIRSFVIKSEDSINVCDKVIIFLFIASVLLFTVLRNSPLHCFDFLRPI